MALTGRTGLLALLGAVVLVVSPSWWTLLAVNALLVVLVAVDLALAGNIRRLGLHRSGETNIRLGETGSVSLIVENLGTRRLRAHVRDAWPPSAGATPRSVSLSVPPGERRRVDTRLLPTRRGDRRAVSVTIRSYGPLRLAARQLSRKAPWTVRVLPAFPSRRHLPA
jgi:uncharacterized protein (DUF58 family)